MTVEEALQLIDSVLVEKRLNDVQEQVFRQCWAGLKYPEIAQKLDYSDAYLRRVGTELWQLLSEGFGERVTKSNFQSVIRRYAASKCQIQDTSVLQAPSTEIPIAHTTSLPTTSTDPNFVGREGAIAQLNLLVKQGAKIITICAPGGVGKTTLAWQYLHTQGFDKILEIWMAKEIQNINSVESEVERWLQQDFGEEPGRDFGVNLERLRQKLRDPNQRIGILIDNLEPALDKNGRFIESRRPYVDLLRVLSDPAARSLTLITSRERLCEPCIEIKDYRLEGLDESSWQEFFSNHSIQTNSPTLAEMHHAYGGNAKAMQILSGVIQVEFSGDLDNFWQESKANLLLDPTLENLVTEQFNRLETIYPEAYKLLCRLGCFRYQDLLTVPIDAVTCLLWDVSEVEQKRIIRDLRNRALIETKNLEYSLHPVVKAEAVIRSKKSKNWERINIKAAEFWIKTIKKIETTEDALKGLEAFFHYIEARQLEKAAEVIVGLRGSDEAGLENLGYACWRLGLSKRIISAILEIKNEVSDAYILSSFYRTLGYAQNQIGNIHKAIEYHEESAKITNIYLKNTPVDISNTNYYRKMGNMLCAYYVNMGLAKSDLWELESAIDYFKKGIPVYEKFGLGKYWVEDQCGLSLSISYLGCLAFAESSRYCLEDAYNLAEDAYFRYNHEPLTVWGRTYSPYFLGKTYRNLGKYEKSFNMYHLCISIAESNYYTQAKANALSGLAELYRDQKMFHASIKQHSISIELLEKIGAKCDLAEAYFQFGLTYQAMGEIEKGLEYRDKAIKLFEEMEAPRQVERVRQAFASSES